MYQTNVEGTRTVLEAAAEAGCKRIVYTSTVGCIGLPREENGQITPSDEQALVSEALKANPYKHSKWMGEQIARELAAEGMPIIVVNPSAPIGPRDVRPTPTGRIIVDFLNRRIPAYLDTGLNWVHVRDVAVGHILAAKKGKVGERYILGHAQGNWTMKQTLDLLGELSGVPAPKRQVPFWSAIAFAHCSEGLAWLTGKPPRASLAGVRMARHKMWFNPAKAIRELGLPQTPPKEGFREAIAWFKKQGGAV
jgi:dihydroflavonol-4-reductase